MKINLLNKTEWSMKLKLSPYRTVFHEYWWGKFTTEYLGGEFFPILVEDENRQWLLPCYIGKPWSENDQVSIGGIGYGGPLPLYEINSPAIEGNRVSEILPEIAQYFKKNSIKATLYSDKSWSLIEDNRFQMSSTVKIPLIRSKDYMFENILTGNVRTAIRKAHKSDVVVRGINSSEDELAQSYNLLIDTQKRVNSKYVTDRKLFMSLAQNNNYQKSKCFVAIKDSRILATTILVWNDLEAFHLFHGWDKNYDSLCANQSILWEMINFAKVEKLESFNMGESHSENLLRAKLRWGGRVELVPRISLYI